MSRQRSKSNRGQNSLGQSEKEAVLLQKGGSQGQGAPGIAFRTGIRPFGRASTSTLEHKGELGGHQKGPVVLGFGGWGAAGKRET